MTRHRRPRRHRLRGVLALTVAALVAAFFLPQADAATPSQDACHTTSNSAPKGDCGPFKQVYRDNFNPGGVAATVPVGAFSGCGGDGNYRCAGAYGTRYYNTLGAYPSGWTDTAGHNGDGNYGPVGGAYRPQDTISVIKSPTGDGQMRVHMWRPASGGSNHVAAVVPLKCMNLRYGKFSERLVVRTLTRGFKKVDLHYTPDEVDYPEAGSSFQHDPVSVFTHGFDEYGKDVAPNSEWIHWHTYSTEITPNHVRIYFDGKLVASRTANYPAATPWVLQNESALGDVQGADPGSHVDIDTTWLTCYRYEG